MKVLKFLTPANLLYLFVSLQCILNTLLGIYEFVIYRFYYILVLPVLSPVYYPFRPLSVVLDYTFYPRIIRFSYLHTKFSCNQLNRICLKESLIIHIRIFNIRMIFRTILRPWDLFSQKTIQRSNSATKSLIKISFFLSF